LPHGDNLTVEYSKEAYARLKKENETTSSETIRKRCRALMAKMSEQNLYKIFMKKYEFFFAKTLANSKKALPLQPQTHQ